MSPSKIITWFDKELISDTIYNWGVQEWQTLLTLGRLKIWEPGNWHLARGSRLFETTTLTIFGEKLTADILRTKEEPICTQYSKLAHSTVFTYYWLHGQSGKESSNSMNSLSESCIWNSEDSHNTFQVTYKGITTYSPTQSRPRPLACRGFPAACCSFPDLPVLPPQWAMLFSVHPAGMLTLFRYGTHCILRQHGK